MFQCKVIHPECGYEIESKARLKTHLDRKHGSWTDEELLQIINAASATEGAAPTGAASFTEASANAPLSDKPLEEPKRRGRKPKEPEPEPLTAYQLTIITRVSHLLAVLPWLIFSYLWQEPGMELTEPEANDIQQGFKDIFDLLGWRPQSRRWAPAIVAEVEYKAGQTRWPLIQKHILKEEKKEAKPDATPAEN